MCFLELCVCGRRVSACHAMPRTKMANMVNHCGAADDLADILCCSLDNPLTATLNHEGLGKYGQTAIVPSVDQTRARCESSVAFEHLNVRAREARFQSLVPYSVLFTLRPSTFHQLLLVHISAVPVYLRSNWPQVIAVSFTRVGWPAVPWHWPMRLLMVHQPQLLPAASKFSCLSQMKGFLLWWP